MSERSQSKPHRIPAQLAELFAVAKESGASSFDIADLFGINPRTVRDAISRLEEDQLRSIRRLFGMQSWVKGQQILSGIQDELLRRIGSGDLEAKAKGKYATSFAQLLTAGAIQTDKMAPLAEDAMMAEPKADHGAGLSALGQLLSTTAEIEDAMRTLPEDSKVRIEVAAAVEIEHQPSSSPPLSAVLVERNSE